jgi:hypothetical protein
MPSGGCPPSEQVIDAIGFVYTDDVNAPPEVRDGIGLSGRLALNYRLNGAQYSYNRLNGPVPVYVHSHRMTLTIKTRRRWSRTTAVRWVTRGFAPRLPGADKPGPDN